MNFEFVTNEKIKRNFDIIERSLKNGDYISTISRAGKMVEIALVQLYEKNKWEKRPNYTFASLAEDARVYNYFGGDLHRAMATLRINRNKAMHRDDPEFTEQQANEMLKVAQKIYAKIYGYQSRYNYIKTKTDEAEYAESLAIRDHELAEAKAAVGKFQAKAEKLEEEAKKPAYNIRAGFKVNW